MRGACGGDGFRVLFFSCVGFFFCFFSSIFFSPFFLLIFPVFSPLLFSFQVTLGICEELRHLRISVILGIEFTHNLLSTGAFRSAFRLNFQSFGPGDVAAGLAVPWQADFYACSYQLNGNWWPTSVSTVFVLGMFFSGFYQDLNRVRTVFSLWNRF